MAGPIPFDAPFTGYGAAPAAGAAPSTYAEEVTKRIRDAAHARAVGAAPVAAPAPVTPVQPPSWLKTAGGFGSKAARFGVATGAGVALGAMGTGMANEAVNTTSSASDATENWYSPVGNRPERALNILSGADITGLGARVGNWMTGGGFTNRAAEAPEANPVLGPAGRDYVSRGSPGYGATPPAAAPAVAAAPAAADAAPAPVAPAGYGANNQPYQPVTRTVGADGTITITGNGQPAGYTESAPARRGGWATSVGRGIGAVMKMRQIAGDNAQNMAGARLLLDAQTKGATAQKDIAAAGISSASLAAANAHLKANPNDFEGYGAILHGRPRSGQFTVPMNAMPTAAGAMPVLNRSTGQMEMKTPKAAMVEGQRYNDGKGGTYTFKNGQKVPDK